VSLLRERVQTFGGAKATVCMAVLQQLMGMLAVELAPFRLSVWTVGTSDFRPFIPFQTRPLQVLVEPRFSVRYRALLVCIFYPEEKLTACSFCEEVIKERCS
jgi:hypothetical protein